MAQVTEVVKWTLKPEKGLSESLLG